MKKRLRRRNPDKDLVSQAKAELLQKTYQVIEEETANKWGSRAVAAYQYSLEATDIKNKVKWLSEAEDYFKEAVEHAATSLKNGLSGKISSWIKPFRDRAQKDFLKCCKL